MAEFKELINRIGMEAVNAVAFAGKKVAEGYKAIDPDVMRHVAQLPLLSYTLFVSRHEAINPGTPDGYPPLVLVHGLGGDRGNLMPMAWYLWAKGRKRSYRIHFEPGQSIEEMASLLARFVVDVRKATSEGRVDMVAHSLGGIVARKAILDGKLEENVRTLITLGTPHKGTYAARYAYTDAIRSLRPDSDLLKELNEAGWPEGVKGYTLWSKNDLLVVPGEFAAMEGTEQIDMTPFTHYSYLISPRCWKTVERALLE